jgi:hypothetical protein
MDAFSILDHANTDNFQQNVVDEKLLIPLERPSEAVVNPIPLFQSIKTPEEFEAMFHLLVAPKNRNDFLRLVDEYDLFMKNGSSALKMTVGELDR